MDRWKMGFIHCWGLRVAVWSLEMVRDMMDKTKQMIPKLEITYIVLLGSELTRLVRLSNLGFNGELARCCSSGSFIFVWMVLKGFDWFILAQKGQFFEQSISQFHKGWGFDVLALVCAQFGRQKYCIRPRKHPKCFALAAWSPLRANEWICTHLRLNIVINTLLHQQWHTHLHT